MLFILEAILNLLGNVHHLVLNGMVLLKACLLWSNDVVLLQVPYQASVDHSFHEFAHTTGEADRTVAVCICSVLALLVDGYHVSFSPALRNMPCLPALVEDSQEFGLCFGAKVFQHFIGDLAGPGDFLSFKVFRASSNSFVLKLEWAVHVFRWILINLVVLDFIMYLLFPVVWYHDVADLLVAVYEAVYYALPCHCLLVSLDLVSSSFMALVSFQSLLPSLFKFSFSVFSLQLVLAACM